MLTITSVFTGLILIFSVIPFLKWYIKKRERDQIIDKIPGPKAYPVIGTMYKFFGTPKDEIFQVLDKVTCEFPNIHRIWFGSHPDVRISKAEYVEKLIATNKHNDKGMLYKFVKPWLGEGLISAKGNQRWHKHRKIITPTFHFKILEGFCDVFADKVEIMIELFEKQLNEKKGEPIDIFPFVTKMALDVICETAMKTNIEAQINDESSYVRSIYEYSEVFSKRILKPWYANDFIFSFTALKVKADELLGNLHGFTEKVMKERKEIRQNKTSENEGTENEFGQKKRTAFLDLLLESNEKDNYSMTDEDIRMEVDTFMFAGHDTTTTNICWTLWLIALDEKIQENVMDELDSIFQGSDRKATYNDLNEMKYLELCIKESLRLYPSAPIIGRILSEDIEFDQYKVPKGTAVTIHIYNLHRDERFFSDPEKFDPERFLPENVAKRHTYSYVPFSAGPRNCIGQKFAVLEEKSVISTVLRKFKIKAADSREAIKPKLELVLRANGGTRLYLEKRK